LKLDYACSFGEAVAIRAEWTDDFSGFCSNGSYAGDYFETRSTRDLYKGLTDESDDRIDFLADGIQ
jgi:hypothetical protein